MKDLNYVVGRLQGLNELVKILKDLVDKKGTTSSEIVTVMTDHIADQLQSILADFEDIQVPAKHKEAFAEIKEKHVEAVEEEPEEEEHAPLTRAVAKEKLEKHDKTVDDLLRDLESLRS